jgi:hypothetical protein
MDDIFIDSMNYETLHILNKIGCCLKCSLRFCQTNFFESKIHPKILLSKVI